ncbi:uncharacterized protein METZ01_LOCUS149329 [marine metagenome]|uniref:Uncharacterized protein n=1 Tax=marine metagenome TaxID=408172 RepID=A0A382A4N8_9ZZZZ
MPTSGSVKRDGKIMSMGGHFFLFQRWAMGFESQMLIC